MLFKILLNFIFGYLNVTVEGYYIERFKNTCKPRGILLCGMKRTKSTIMNMNIGASEFKGAVKIAKKHGCRIKINGKHGLPFVMKKYKKRKIFFILLLLVIITIYALSKFVWNIEVTGNNTIDSNEIIETLNNDGLNIGVLKSKINTEEIINKIRYQRDDIAWIGIELQGTNAIVKIVEADSKPEVVDENDYCNIVASKDGIVQKITAQNGTLMVTEGAEVKKGDILIAGYMDGKYTDRNYVNAMGEVKALVTYTQTEKIYKKETKKEQTGNFENKYSIKINNFKINFYKTLSKYENYDTMYTSKKIKLFSNFYLPIEIIRNTNYEVTNTEIEYNETQAKDEGQKRAEEKLNSLIDGDISNKEVFITDMGRYYNVEVTYQVIEDIGTKEKIVL